MTPNPRLDHIERRLDAVERDIQITLTWLSVLVGCFVGITVLVMLLASRPLAP